MGQDPVDGEEHPEGGQEPDGQGHESEPLRAKTAGER
jgi:hypothetical protein